MEALYETPQTKALQTTQGTADQEGHLQAGARFQPRGRRTRKGGSDGAAHGGNPKAL